MKKKFFLLGLLGLLTLIPLGLHAEDVNMTQFGHHEVIVERGKPITYYDYNGTKDIGGGYAFATTIFKPANAGDMVTITFEEVGLHKTYKDWNDWDEDWAYNIATLKVYNGVFDVNSVTYPKFGKAEIMFPNNTQLLDTLADKYTNKVYTSTDATGALSCCFHAYDCLINATGWKATVSVIEAAPAVEDIDVKQPQWGKQVVTVQSGQTITFYDYKGCYVPNSTEGKFSADAMATTIFKPAKEGEKVKIVFETVLMTIDRTDYASLKIYKGVFDTTSVEGYTYNVKGFPKNDNMLEDLTGGTFSNKTYMSSDATGALSVCYHAYTTDWDKQGWKATVTTVSSNPMEVKSATADYTNTRSELYVGEQNINMGGLRIVTDGLGDPDYLTSISFTLTGNVFDATQLRLYQTDKASVAGLTPIEGTITKSGSTYTLTCNQALEAGNNNFCLAGDMQSQATIGAASTLTITGLTTKNGFTTLTAATAKEQTITEVRMVNGSHLTVYVSGDMPFYDDGGVDGKISNNFSGYITFVPSTEGKKVQIDLHDIHIFIASLSYNSDVLKFYNGKTADEANLLYNVKDSKIDNLALKSTSDDGAITVYLYSKTPGSYVQGSGFEAVVSEFSAVQMEVASSAVTKQSGKVAGCAEGVQVMQFCLTTKNTEPALQPVLFHFNTGNTYERIDSATLYFTGTSAEFATTQKVGKVAVTGNEFTIPASGISLTEGENWFFLTYDVACNVQNGQTIAANITQADFGNGTEYKGFSNSEDVLTINNTLYSDCGSKTVHVYGEWIFTHTAGDLYPDRYDAVTCNQTTTFVPTTEGMVIQMNFADFAISFNSYSKADFRIYAGQGTEGELLWEADKDNYIAGPGLVRSNAEDGALTVVFNANTEYWTHIGADKGWHATVSEYQPKPMTIEATELTAISSDALTRGQKSAALLGLNITTTGDLTPPGVKNITVTLSDCAAAVDSLLLLQGETIVARAEVKGTEVVLPLNVTLLEGENAYTLAANIAQDATIGTEVSVLGVQIAVGEATLTPAVPVNKRTIRNMYLLKSGNQRVEVDNAPLSFYDDGGAEGKLTLGLKGTVTFVPTVPNTAIQLKFKQWALNGADNFYVYYGENTKDKVDVSLSYYTKDIDKLTLISEDATGAITITYESRGSIATDGWEIEVSCHALQPLTLDSVKVEDVSAATVNRGSADVQILRAAVYVSGDRGKMPVENFNVETTLGAEAVKVYSTGTADAFGTTNLMAKADTISNRGTYYYWITIDVPAATEEGTVVTATLKSVDVNKTTVQPKNVVMASFEVIGGMHGTYLVGASDAAKYKTIQSAIDALQNGIESAVTFLIEPGTYTEYLTIPEIDGVSAENTVTFRSQTGNREDVIIKYDTYSPQSSVLGDETQGIVNVNGADYITFSNLTLTTGNDSYHSVVLVRNKSEHVTIDNCNIYRDLILTTGKHVVYVTAKDEKTINNYFTLSNSTLTGGYIGVSVSGNLNNKQVGARIIGNTVTEQGSMGIYLSGGERQALVDGNIVKNTATTKTSTKAMDITLSEGSQVSNNYLYTNLGVNADGLYIRVVKGTEEAPVQIFNNVIDHCANGTSSSYAVNFNKTSTNTIFANNTIRTSGESVYPCRIGTTQNNLQVLNNIFYSDAAAAMWISSKNYIATTAFEHNLLYSESGKLGKIGADEYNDIAAWRTAIKSTTDISESVQFESAEVLRPTNKGNLVSAQVLDFVTTDITGLKRAAVPTIGAYEWKDQIGTGCRPAEAGSIRIFPTITCDMLHIYGAADAEVRILNLQGQLMYRTMLAADAETLDVNALPQGTYLIAVNGNVLRFIKQ
mgnify:CR=1 FL=1